MAHARPPLSGHRRRQPLNAARPPNAAANAHSGLSKQAVQQLLDDLEVSGIVYRGPDPRDRRAKIVRYTDAGKGAMQDGAPIKRQIEARLAQGLGEGDLAKLRDLLEGIVDKGFAEGGRKPD